MDVLDLFCLFFIACIDVSYGKISFSCKKYNVKGKGVDEIMSCVDKHLKLFYSKQQQSSLDYKCCEEYTTSICINKISLRCSKAKSEDKLRARASCPSADTFPCTKVGPDDIVEEDLNKNKKKTKSKPAAAGNPQGSKPQSSGAKLKSKLCIFALSLSYFM